MRLVLLSMILFLSSLSWSSAQRVVLYDSRVTSSDELPKLPFDKFDVADRNRPGYEALKLLPFDVRSLRLPVLVDFRSGDWVSLVGEHLTAVEYRNELEAKREAREEALKLSTSDVGGGESSSVSLQDSFDRLRDLVKNLDKVQSEEQRIKRIERAFRLISKQLEILDARLRELEAGRSL